MCWKCDHPNATADDYLDELRKTMLRARLGGAVRRKRPIAIRIHRRAARLRTTRAADDRCLRAAGDAPAEHRGQGHDGRQKPDAGSEGRGPLGTSGRDRRGGQPDAHMEWAVAFGGPEVRALQLVWADGRGRWPWAAAFSDGRARQPVLGVRCSERVAVVLRHVAQLRRRRHHLGHHPVRQRHLVEGRARRTATPKPAAAVPGTASRMSSGPSMPQYSVAPDRLTTALIHCVLMPNRLNASNCNSPDGAWSTIRRSSATPSASVRYMVRPSPIISVGRSAGMSASQRRVGDRCRDDVAVLARREQLPAQVGDVGIVDVVPLDARARDPAGSTGCPGRSRGAARSPRDVRRETGAPSCRSARDRVVTEGDVARRDRGLRPVVVDAVDDLLGPPVAEDRLLEVGVERLGVERGQHGLRCPGQVDVQFLGHDAARERSRRWSAGLLLLRLASRRPTQNRAASRIDSSTGLGCQPNSRRALLQSTGASARISRSDASESCSSVPRSRALALPMAAIA